MTKFLKLQAYGFIALTLLVVILRLATKTVPDNLPEGSSVSLPDAGDANRSALVGWMLGLIIFTVINVAVALIKSRKKFSR